MVNFLEVLGEILRVVEAHTVRNFSYGKLTLPEKLGRLLQAYVSYEFEWRLPGERHDLLVEMSSADAHLAAQIFNGVVGVGNILFHLFYNLLDELLIEWSDVQFCALDSSIDRQVLLNDLSLRDKIADPRFKDLEVKWLADVFVGAGFKSFNLLLFTCSCRQQYHRNVRRTLI